MSRVTPLCYVATTFKKSGEIDEVALRKSLRKFIDNQITIYLGSGGNGEGHALTLDELSRVYQIGVEECKGKIGVNANLPEQFTARETIAHAEVAIAAGCELLKVYTLEARHGMRPTGPELAGYYDDVLTVIKHPITLAVNSSIQSTPAPEVIAEIVDKHEQIKSVALSHQTDLYLHDLMRLIQRKDILYSIQFASNSLNCLLMGAKAVHAAEANVLPKTLRLYVDLYEAGDYAEMNKVAMDLLRFRRFTQPWKPAFPRIIKMAMKVFNQPGAAGGLRRPYMMPPPDQMKIFTDEILRLGIPEIEEMARAAGLKIPH